MTAAIYFHPEAYSTAGPKLMGRNAAGESFLRGFFAHKTSASLHIQTDVAEHAQVFKANVPHNRSGEPIKVIGKANLQHLSEPGLLYLPGPGLAEQAWKRARAAHLQHASAYAAWSICGVTHTTASAGAMDAICDWVTAPIQPWDAVICTSYAVKANVLSVLTAHEGYLSERLGTTKIVRPVLPVIPLGVHTSDFVFSDTQREQARAALGADADTIVVLFAGRLSFHAKAHPLAMYQALAKTASTLIKGQSLMLVECGWHANSAISDAFTAAAQLACPGVVHRYLDGRDSEARMTAWAGADIFCSLSDNIQETYGITPVEAMAAGLPVVVSDWNGYRDTVRDGVDGFRIRTVMPGAGMGDDLARRHALGVDSYDMYCGHSCSFVAVDVHAAAEALTRLCKSRDLRQSVGLAGRAHAVSKFDWAAVIPQYEALWAELAVMRSVRSDLALTMPVWPARMDPFTTFVEHATQTLRLDMRLALVDDTDDLALTRLASYRQLAMVNFADAVLPSSVEVKTVVMRLQQGPQEAAQLVKGFDPSRIGVVFRGLSWLLKLGILKIDL